MKRTQIFLLGIMLVGSLAVFLVVLVFVFNSDGLLSSFEIPFLSKQPVVRIFVQAPPMANIGEEFTIVVTVHNDSPDMIKVDEIRLPMTLLDVATVKFIFPGSMEQTDFDGNTTGFFIGHWIASSDYQEFEITLSPRTNADVSGDLLIGINSHYTPAGFRMVFESSLALATSESPTPSYTPTLTPAPPTLTPTPLGPPYHAVVKLTSKNNNGDIYRLGSGSIISPDGLILTNAHIVESNSSTNPVTEIMVSTTNLPTEPPIDSYFAEVVISDSEMNVAVLRITRDINDMPVDSSTLNLPFVPLGDSDDLVLGDPLSILGYPIIGGNTITLTEGDVGGFTSEGRFGDRAYIKTSATIASGASGGLVVNQNGYMVAIPTQLGSGGGDAVVDCRILVDTNLDGRVNQRDSCIPVGGFINALRPINLSLYLIEATRLTMESTQSP